MRPNGGLPHAILPSGRGFATVVVGSLAFIGVYAAAWAGLNAAHEIDSSTFIAEQAAAPVQPKTVPVESTAAATLMVFQTPYEHNDGPVQIALTERDEAPTGPAFVFAAPTAPSTPQPLRSPEPHLIAAEIPAPGCVTPLRKFAESQIIHFRIGSASVSDKAMSMLGQLGERAQSCPEAMIQVTGHSDSSGSDLINLALSWERADNTLAALAELGHDTSAFTTIGFGDRQPLTEGDADDEALNRRVEFRVLTNTAGTG